MTSASTVHPASPQARGQVVLGVCGGSGLYEMEALEYVERIELSTPYGAPSDAYVVGSLARDFAPLKVVFLPRHGRGHRFSPSEINYRANIHGFKQLGVTHLLGISAVGSLRDVIAPGDAVLPDQFIDRTCLRKSSFFGDGVVVHVQMGAPTCPRFRSLVARALRARARPNARVHEGGTCVVMEGPAFSTRAESELYRTWGADVIGMTAMPEAKLAREAEMAYAMIALATDYDCWHHAADEVSVEAVLACVRDNVGWARETIARLAGELPHNSSELPFPQACAHAIITDVAHIRADVRERVDLLIGHYLVLSIHSGKSADAMETTDPNP